MIALQIDYGRLNAFLFTDYKPFGSPIRFDSNLIYLFITTDAFWILLYGLITVKKPPKKFWAVLPLVPLCVIGLSIAKYKFSGPVFEIGGSFSGEQRGQEIRLIYASGEYNREAVLDWFNSKGYLSRPWENPNIEHSAVYFTTSMQAIKWRKLDLVTAQNTMATICLYEEGKSTILHEGYADCFSGRDTIEELFKKLAADNPTGFGKVIDFWNARVLFCRDIDLPQGYIGNIKRYNVCKFLKRDFKRDRKRFTNLYGASSPELHFVDATAKKHRIE
jgi:hypothetical protein